MKRPVVATLSVAAALALAVAPTLPAAAAVGASLPVGDELYVIDYSFDAPTLYQAQDASTALFAPVGPLGVSQWLFHQAAYDPANGKSYALATPAGPGAALYEINTATGAATLLGELSLPVESIAIGLDGTIYAWAPATNHGLYTVDPTTLDLTLVYDAGYSYVFSSAVNPTDGGLYVAPGTGTSASGTVSIGHVYQVSGTWTNQWTGLVEGLPSYANILSIQFDSTGVLWLLLGTEDENEEPVSELWSVAGGSGTATSSGVTNDDPFVATDLLIIPAQVSSTPTPTTTGTDTPLPVTGDSTLPLVIGGAGIVLLGAVIVILVGRRRRHAN